MPAHSSTGQKPEAYFARILAALAMAAGGTLRVKASDMDLIDKETVLVKDYDSATQEVVIRIGSRFNEVYRVQPEVGTPWQPTTKVDTTETSTRTTPPPSAHQPVATPDNQKLADMERVLLKRRVARLYAEDLRNRKMDWERQHTAPVNS